MSSQDDHQISEQRRRLFKALSAVPVVATLRPGEALANGSAFQCAAKEMALPETKYYKVAESTLNCGSLGAKVPGNGCHAFLEREVWDPGIVDGVGNEFWIGKFVVRTEVATDPMMSTYFWIRESDNSYGSIAPSAGATANGITIGGLSGSEMTFYDSSAATIIAVEKNSLPGLFVAIGGPDSTTNPTTWLSSTVWPQTEANKNNVLGGSCLMSFPSSAGFRLVDS